MDEVSLKFENRVAVITGAAGNIGLAACRMFCESGVKVAATDLSAEVVEKRIAPLKERGFDIRAYAQDVTDREVLRSSFDQILSDFGKIDILVNNAGVWEHCDVKGRQRFEEMSIEEIRRIVDINFYGVVNCLQIVIGVILCKQLSIIISFCRSSWAQKQSACFGCQTCVEIFVA